MLHVAQDMMCKVLLLSDRRHCISCMEKRTASNVFQDAEEKDTNPVTFSFACKTTRASLADDFLHQLNAVQIN